MEQLVILIIIGLISLVNWVMQKAAEKREAAKLQRSEKREIKRETRRNIYTQPAPAAPPVARRASSPRDPLKELMDALGLPSDELPPPPVTRRVEMFEEEEFASAEDTTPPPLPAPAARTPRWHPPRVSRPDEKTAQLASAFAAGEERPAPAWHGTSLRDLLAGRDAQRKAIILAEILGTPRGLASASDFRGNL